MACVESTLQQVFREHWPRYRDSHGLPLRAHKAGAALSACRTGELGGHVKRCRHGHIQGVWYNACRHRACPLCAWRDRERWVGAQLRRLPACDYFHVIFTIPDTLNRLWQYNRRELTNLLMRASWETLREMLADPKHLGALPGAVGAFHSWGQTLWMHPHGHFLVSAGGVDGQGVWRPCPFSGLLPAQAVSAKFRGKLRAWLIREIKADRLSLPSDRSPRQWLNELNRLGRKRWNVRIPPRYRHGRGVVRYLGRYLKGGCVSDRRITRLGNGEIRLAYKDNFCDPPKRRSVEFTASEFMGRVLGHVPETGQHLVRSYGLFATARAEQLERVREALGELPIDEADELLYETLLTPCRPPELCLICGEPLDVFALPRPARDPPRRAA